MGCARRSLLCASVSLGLALALSAGEDDWQAPPEERARKNPVPRTEEALSQGRALYERHCLACHGPAGKGDGPSARFGSRLPQDLSDPARQGQMTDGEMLWKITRGRRVGPEVVMPRAEREVPREEDRWKLVLYVRSLAAPTSP